MTKRAGAVCWMLKSPEGILAVYGGGSASNRDAIKKFMGYNREQKWSQWYRQGWRAVRVSVTELV